MKKSKMGLAMLSILLLSSLLVSSFAVTPSKAADYTKVGVEVGDWAYYKAYTNATGAADPRVDWNMTCTNIDRSNVTMRVDIIYPNGTVTSQTTWGNISNGQYAPGVPMYVLLIVPDLAKDDPVFIGSPLKINDTGTMIAANKVRDYTHLNFTFMAVGMDLRHDRATGMVIQVCQLGWDGAHHYLVTLDLLSTSLWSPASAPTIDSPADVSYELSATGNSITWHPSSEIPRYCTITRNGTVTQCAPWDGGNKTLNVDGLAAGTYIYTCTVNDTMGRQASDSVTVTVTPAAAVVQPIPVEVLLLVGGGIAAVAVVAGIVVLRRRSS